MIASIFGIKVSVASFICVVAWNMLIKSPTISPVKSNGSDTMSVILYVSMAKEINFASTFILESFKKFRFCNYNKIILFFKYLKTQVMHLINI